MSDPILSRHEDPFNCELLPWDSEFFGLRIARVVGQDLSPQYSRDIDAWCFAHRINCLYFNARPDDLETIRTAEAAGYQLADVRITLDCRVPDSEYLPSEDIRAATLEDLPALRAIARTSHTNTRFYFDGRFPHSRCDDLYDRWITVSLQGYAQAVFLAESTPGSVVGYITAHIDSKGARIGLSAVEQSGAGKGWGARLVQRALAFFHREGASIVTVDTQGRNIAAQRLYQRCGFRTRSTGLFYHKWYTPSGD